MGCACVQGNAFENGCEMWPPAAAQCSGKPDQTYRRCGDADSNGTCCGRMWFASSESGCPFATYFSPAGRNPNIDEEIAEAHQAMLAAQVVMQ
jgi:hypothetical protein